MLSKIAAVFLGCLLMQLFVFLCIGLYKWYKRSKRIPAPPEEPIESNIDKIVRILGFNPYDFPTITKLYNKLEKRKASNPATCPIAVHVLFDTINRNNIPGGEKTITVFPASVMLDLIDIKCRREQLIRKYNKDFK